METTNSWVAMATFSVRTASVLADKNRSWKREAVAIKIELHSRVALPLSAKTNCSGNSSQLEPKTFPRPGPKERMSPPGDASVVPLPD